YVASAVDDRWADPKGEFLSVVHAEPVYQLLGESGFGATEMPEVDHPIMDTLGYHIRTGGHNVTDFDWKAYLDFADKHFGR
ncbi:MAG: acetylxylan esterase, partial [Candidatus Omnitrophica bacterium]|nr:acetylxylan esterase [Candidatus Omnitrophota bacterium]